MSSQTTIFVPTTERSPIHLLDHHGHCVCGSQSVSRAWNSACWPTDPRVWPNLCACCWDQAHAPVTRSERHTRDTDCTLDANACCVTCGVYHGDPCGECNGKGFHSHECSEMREVAA
jgi:hypothetical protein